MRKNLISWMVTGALLLLLASSANAVSGPYSVYASVTTGSGSIQAVLVPGEFTVPEGKNAVIVSFKHDDPNTGYHSEKLGQNIYSITMGKYMVDGSGNPLFRLPPGKYRFFVGGYPGATGVLTYNLEP
ncbi:hypothetical protein TheveDRAFT_1197 [Thermanaerovibrio velox DSM 12556]|uniref:Uncharacterized protein n=1 Tax=Thermanaerovibrio velox DSM 12556 TaxID=926567 RepID=H0USN0_9BACT|nr:hypothetical protein [Thermanaerovibrio velox]EHM10319.1 hypothetical protein TheveDRAFT_1197 [Thermanaerovibrio velox DSM 12556]